MGRHEAMEIFSLAAAHAISKFATWLSFVALLMRVQELLHLSLGLAILIVSRRMPAMLSSYAGGVLADRSNPKGVLIGTNVAMAAILLLMWGLDFSSSGFYLPLFLSFLALSALEGVYKPALQALLYRLCSTREFLERSNTALNSTGMLTVLLAGTLSPWLTLRLGLNALLLFNASIYLVALALLLALPARPCTPLPHAPLANARQEPAPHALAALGLNCVVSIVYAFMALAVIQYPYEVYRNVYGGTTLMNATMALGILLSVLAYTLRPAPAGLTMGAFCGRTWGPAALLCCAFMLFVRSDSIRWALPCLAVSICGLGYLKILAENVFLLSSAGHLMGRSFSIFYIMDEAVVAGASLLLGFLADRASLVSVGTHLSLVGVAMVILIFILGASNSRPFWIPARDAASGAVSNRGMLDAK